MNTDSNEAVAMQVNSDVESLVSSLQDLLLESVDIHTFLDQLAVLASRSLAARGGLNVLCGVTLELRSGRQLTVASSDEQARKLDEVQYDYDEGPCLEALRTGRIVMVDDVTSDTRWPAYLRAIEHLGVHSALALPLALDADAHAALNIYGEQAHAFDDGSVERARLFAEQASKALRISVRGWASVSAAENLQAAMQSRTGIDLAVGIIMGQNRCTQEEAFDILRRASNARNVKVRQIAEELVASLNRAAPAETHFED